MSRWPKVSTAAATSLEAFSGREKSAARAAQLVWPSSFTSCWAGSWAFWKLNMTLAPAATNIRTAAAPIPREPPVMRATLLLSERVTDMGRQFPPSSFQFPAKSCKRPGATTEQTESEIGDHEIGNPAYANRRFGAAVRRKGRDAGRRAPLGLHQDESTREGHGNG